MSLNMKYVRSRAFATSQLNYMGPLTQTTGDRPICKFIAIYLRWITIEYDHPRWIQGIIIQPHVIWIFSPRVVLAEYDQNSVHSLNILTHCRICICQLFAYIKVSSRPEYKPIKGEGILQMTLTHLLTSHYTHVRSVHLALPPCLSEVRPVNMLRTNRESSNNWHVDVCRSPKYLNAWTK